MATLDKLNLTEEVAIVFTSDHGIYAGYPGDAGFVGKPWVINDGVALLVGGDSAGNCKMPMIRLCSVISVALPVTSVPQASSAGAALEGTNRSNAGQETDDGSKHAVD